MTKDRFASSPFADVRVSDLERHELMNLADIYVEDYIEKYEEFVVTGKRRVDKHRWQHVKSKDNLHVYTERNRKVLSRAGMTLKDSLSATQQLRPSSTIRDPPVVLSVGTFSGELDDLMYGVVNPTLDDMRIKASYVHGFGSAAVLCSVLEPTKKYPFRSIVIKWIAVDMPLQSTNLVKSRDFVFIEATGTTYLSNGDRVGYHLLHSIEFPQTKPLPNKIRGNLSMFGCFKRKHRQVIENFAWGIVDAGGEIMRSLVIAVTADALLSATNYVYCGQMKKLAWVLQHPHSVYGFDDQTRSKTRCVVCSKNTTYTIGSIGKSKCGICHGSVCYSCKIRQRISFISWDGKLVQRKIVFCGRCVGKSNKMSAQDPARAEVTGFEVCTTSNSLSWVDTSGSSLDQIS